MVEAFEGNKAETKTMLPVITAFMTAHQLTDVTVVADAGMISEVNQQAIEDTGLSFILGTRIPDVPYAVARWRREHPGQDLPDGHVFTQPWPATGAQKAAGCRDKIARRYRTVQIRVGQHILTAQSRYHPTCAMPSRSSGGQAVRTELIKIMSQPSPVDDDQNSPDRPAHHRAAATCASRQPAALHQILRAARPPRREGPSWGHPSAHVSCR